jgi:serine/threonine protein kinase
VFARKVLHVFGSVSPDEIDTEARAITELYCHGNHRNVVEVFQHGFLPNNSFYYIDMELCDSNLHDYVYQGRSINWMTPESNEPTFVDRNAPLPDKMLNVWTIMRHVCQGVEYIHRHNQVHRDLKPQNSSDTFLALY